MITDSVLISLRLQNLNSSQMARIVGVSKQAICYRIKKLAKDNPSLLFSPRGYQAGLKKCIICKQYLSLSKFHKNKSTWDGLERYCKDCNVIKQRTYYVRNPSNVKKTNKHYEKTHINKWLAWHRARCLYPHREMCKIPGCNKLGVRHHTEYENDTVIFLCPFHHKQVHINETLSNQTRRTS